jgi:curved DNA-binding protein CbpA
LDPKGYYTILGLSSNATGAEINKAYRLLALKYHPDRNKSAFSHSTMVRLNAAYEVLSVPDRKYLYDIGELVDDVYNRPHSTKYKTSSDPDTGDSPWKWHTFLVIALFLTWVTYLAISIYQAQFGTH